MLATRKRSGAGRLTKNSRIFKAIIQGIQEKKGHNIISLDLRKIPEAVADFFIICEAGSTTQVKAIADFVEEHVRRTCEEKPYKHEGIHALQWVLLDYVNIVIHIMLPECTRFYKAGRNAGYAALEEHNL
jgi:ribosome-associated protein